MAGRHRKPPKFAEAGHYIGWVIFWVLLAALIFLCVYLVKGLLT